MRECTVLPAAAREATQWKNGGGVTRTIAVHPAESTLDDFEWRISIATVSAAGPFSRFDGYDRLSLVIDGALELTDGSATIARLERGSPALAILGERALRGRPIGQDATVLNVIVRRGLWAAEMVTQQQTPLTLGPARSIAIALALAPLRLLCDGQPVELNTHDALQIAGRASVRLEGLESAIIVALSPADHT